MTGRSDLSPSEGAGDSHSEVVLAHWTAFSRGTSQRPSNNHKEGGANPTSLLQSQVIHMSASASPRAFECNKEHLSLKSLPSTRVEGLVYVWCWDLMQVCVCTCPRAQAQEHSCTCTSHVCNCQVPAHFGVRARLRASRRRCARQCTANLEL